jgi:hypothetical protein
MVQNLNMKKCRKLRIHIASIPHQEERLDLGHGRRSRQLLARLVQRVKRSRDQMKK